MWQPQGFYNQYALRTPVILTGSESIRGLYNFPVAKAAVIHGASFTDETLFRAVFAKKDICFIKRSWEGEPDMNGLKGTISQLEQYQPDTIIAVGGGSVIDGGKLCRLFYEFPYFEAGITRIDGQMIKTRFIAVPTTIGSGSEVSSAAVFADRIGHRKDMIVLHELQPDVIVYDRRYVEDTPIRLLCASAMDAMAHVLEGYVSNIGHSMMDILAEEGLTLLRRELDKVMNPVKGTVDFERLQYAGLIGGIVQNHCIVGAAHAIAHQLADHGYSHGEAAALLLPAAIKANAADCETAGKYQRIAEIAGFRDMGDMISFLYDILERSGIREREASLKRMLEEMLGEASFRENVKNDRGGKGNPVDITDCFLGQLIRGI